jgi:hypothetical protein
VISIPTSEEPKYLAGGTETRRKSRVSKLTINYQLSTNLIIN